MNNSNKIITEKHISFVSINDLTALCAPLFDNTDISFFSYARIYPDNSLIALDTYLEWHDFLYRTRGGKEIVTHEMLELLSQHKGNLFCKKSRQFSSFVEEASLSYKWFRKFGIDSFLMLAEKTDEYWELFGFGSRFGINLVPFYFSNYDLLQKFMFYFHEKATDLIDSNEKNRIILPNRSIEYVQLIDDLSCELALKKRRINSINEVIRLKRYPITYKNKRVYITCRELECLQYLSSGRSYKEIGSVLNISDRTVEKHLQHIRDKFDMIISNSKLLKVFNSSRLDSIDFEKN